MRTDRRGFFRLVGSAVALLGGRPRGGERSTAYELHRATRNTALGVLGERLSRLRESASTFEAYPGAPRSRLPPPAREPSLSLADAVSRYAPASGFGAAPVTREELARLLYFTNGVTGKVLSGGAPVHLRAAPSAGALYAGEVYALVERVRGIEPGVYYYAVREHELVQLRRGSFAADVAGALERPGEIEGAAVVVLLTNVFDRYRRRYANRAYRYALIDTGHIGENLRLAAVSARFAEAGPLRFHDDRLNDLLGVDGRLEAVCALHALGRPRGAGPVERGPTRALAERQDAPEHSASSGGSVPERYHEATKLVPAIGRAEPAAPGPIPTLPDATGPPLPKRAVPTVSTETAIAARRSAASFRKAPVALEDVSFVLDLAAGHARLRRAAEVDVYLVAHRVSGLAPGLYRYRVPENRLAPQRAGDLSAAMADACLGQAKAGSAAAGVLMVGRLVDAVQRGGARSYRELLVESGAIGQRVYLAAEALGLAARNLAAFFDGRLNGIAGLDGRREAVIHLTMLGPGE